MRPILAVLLALCLGIFPLVCSAASPSLIGAPTGVSGNTPTLPEVRIQLTEVKFKGGLAPAEIAALASPKTNPRHVLEKYEDLAQQHLRNVMVVPGLSVTVRDGETEHATRTMKTPITTPKSIPYLKALSIASVVNTETLEASPTLEADGSVSVVMLLRNDTSLTEPPPSQHQAAPTSLFFVQRLRLASGASQIIAATSNPDGTGTLLFATVTIVSPAKP